MIWNNSDFLWLLWILPLLYFGWYIFRRIQKKRARSYFDERLLNKLRRNYWVTGDRVRLLSFLGALFFFIIALAGPKIGTEVREVQRKGVNLMVALDLSRSMNTQDVSPSRLDKAKLELTRLVNRLQGDRIGLIIFTDEAFIQVPLTTDYSAFRMLLDIANTRQMPSSGTNFKAAMDRALESFQALEDQGGNAANVLLFVADGENHETDYRDSLKELAKNNVTVFAVGVGTSEGALIPLFDQTGSVLGYHRDNQGNTVTSRLEPETMRQIARSGSGEYYQIQSGRDNIEPFFSKLDELERGEYSSQEFADYKDRYQLVMIPGFICLLLSMFFPVNREGSSE